MMLDELRALLSRTPANATFADHTQAIGDDSTFGNCTKSASQLVWRRQGTLYCSDTTNPTCLAAAQGLKRRLGLILEGEKPFDIFVRWQPLAEQPIGWNSDLNDGMRLNIRPFMTAEVMRNHKKPKRNITWDRGRGRGVESAPWFKVFRGDRTNDHHLTLAEKRAARDAIRQGA